MEHLDEDGCTGTGTGTGIFSMWTFVPGTGFLYFMTGVTCTQPGLIFSDFPKNFIPYHLTIGMYLVPGTRSRSVSLVAKLTSGYYCTNFIPQSHLQHLHNKKHVKQVCAKHTILMDDKLEETKKNMTKQSDKGNLLSIVHITVVIFLATTSSNPALL